MKRGRMITPTFNRCNGCSEYWHPNKCCVSTIRKRINGDWPNCYHSYDMLKATTKERQIIFNKWLANRDTSTDEGY